MIREVARRYRFDGTHHVPGLPEPWCTPHPHAYTVEVVARGAGEGEGSVVVDTDEIDRAWSDEIAPLGAVETHDIDVVNLDEEYGPVNTTVEALALRWLEMFRSYVPEVVRVVVWEDESRWGSAQIDVIE